MAFALNDNSSQGYGDMQTLASPQSYDNTQYNTQGESLSPTPPPNGAAISVDHSNDTRTAADFKSDAQQVNKDIADVTGGEGWTSAAGNNYSDPPSRKDMIVDGIIAMGLGFLSNANEGQQLSAAVGAAYKSEKQAQRFKKIDELESKGYNPIDIDKWIQTGDGKDLLTNKGKWEDNHDGSQTNSLTGERRTVSLSPLQQQQQANFEAQQAQQQAQQQQAQANADRSYQLQLEQNKLTNRRYDIEDQRYQAGLAATQAKTAEEKQTKEAERQSTLTSQSDQAATLTRDSKNLLNHENLSDIFGSYDQYTPTLTAKSQEAEALRDKIVNQVFLQQRQYVKGGAITDFESQKAEGAATILNRHGIDETTAKNALKDIIDTNALAQARIEAKAKNPNAPAIKMAPDAAIQQLRSNYTTENIKHFKDAFGYVPIYR